MNGSISIPRSDWPPDDIDWVLDINCGSGNPVYTPDDCGTGVDLTDVSFVRSDHNPDRYYHALQADSLDTAIDAWEDECGYHRAVERVVKRILTWKQDGAGTPAASRHEQAVKAAFNRKNPVRLASHHGIATEEPKTDEEPVLEHLAGLSRAYLRYHYQTPISVFRGCKYYLSEIAADLFERPTDSEIRIDTTVLLNVTIDDQIAYQYSPLVVDFDIEIGDVALAVDHLLWHRWIPDVHTKPQADSDRYADGEFQIFGKKAESFDHQRLKVLDSEPLSTLINALPEDESLTDIPDVADDLGFSVADHRAIAICVTELSNDDKTLSAGAPRNRVQNWYAILTYECQDESFEVFKNDLNGDERFREAGIEKLEEDVENVTRAAPQRYQRHRSFSETVKHE